MAAFGGVLAVGGAAPWLLRVGWKTRAAARLGGGRSARGPHRAPPRWFGRLLTALDVGRPDGTAVDPARGWPGVAAVLAVLAIVAVVLAPIGSITVGGLAAVGLVVARRRPRREAIA